MNHKKNEPPFEKCRVIYVLIIPSKEGFKIIFSVCKQISDEIYKIRPDVYCLNSTLYWSQFLFVNSIK